MYLVVVAFIVIVSLLLILAVVIQNSKGGGLATNLQAANVASSIMGVRGGADWVEKATWSLLGTIVLLAFVGNVVLKTTLTGSEDKTGGSGLRMKSAVEGAKSAPAPSPSPSPAPAPAQNATPAPNNNPTPAQ